MTKIHAISPLRQRMIDEKGALAHPFFGIHIHENNNHRRQVSGD